MPDVPAEKTDWWNALLAAASLVTRDGWHPEDDGLIRAELLRLGFSAEGTLKALNWIEKAELSGNVIDALGMLAPQGDGTRVQNPMERVFVSDKLWDQLELCRQNGILSGDTAERLIEGIRAIDTRDWDDDEVHAFMADVLKAAHSENESHRFAMFMRGQSAGFYS